ncbi:MAG: hypothetical protein C4558_02435 [Dehalococcoidia bacterium]|nr:MAG: hypothetical protein C4558_02435 [Dehalococcoidia bacterium]
MPTKTKEAVFISTDNYYRAVKVPEDEEYQGRRWVKVPGEAAVFNNGIFRTSDPEMIDFLKDHVDFNRMFWLQGEEPDRQRPFTEDVIAAITKASIAGDVATVSELRRQESVTHSRSAVFAAADAALEALGATESDATDVEPSPEPEAPEGPGEDVEGAEEGSDVASDPESADEAEPPDDE